MLGCHHVHFAGEYGCWFWGHHILLVFAHLPWQRCMGVEPTGRRAGRHPNRFEDGEGHQAPDTSALSIARPSHRHKSAHLLSFMMPRTMSKKLNGECSHKGISIMLNPKIANLLPAISALPEQAQEELAAAIYADYLDARLAANLAQGVPLPELEKLLARADEQIAQGATTSLDDWLNEGDA